MKHSVIGHGTDGWGADHLRLQTRVVRASADISHPGQTVHMLHVVNRDVPGDLRAIGWWVDESGEPRGSGWAYAWQGPGRPELEKVSLRRQSANLHVCRIHTCGTPPLRSELFKYRFRFPWSQARSGLAGRA